MRYLLVTGLALAITPLAFISLPAAAQSLGFPDDYSLMSRSSDRTDAAPATPSAQTLDEIVAVVGEGVILESELNQAVARIRARAGGRADQMPPNILRSQVLDQLIRAEHGVRHRRPARSRPGQRVGPRHERRQPAEVPQHDHENQ